jgi:hypothetical protein
MPKILRTSAAQRRPRQRNDKIYRMNEVNSEHDKITPTADLISYFRIFSDVPYTKEIAEMTNAEETARKILGDDFENSMFMAAMAESRYKRIDIHARKFQNFLEVAVGRSPRGLIFTEDPSVQYVATDLPDSLVQYRMVVQELMARHALKRPNLHFAPANALNLDELKAASNLLPDGPLTIISEGFMPYLSMEEKKIFLKNVREILSKRGGCFITSDIVVLNRNINRGPEIHGLIAKTSGRDMRDRNFDDEDHAERFVNECGFDYEIFSDKVDVTSAQQLHLGNDPVTQRVVNRPIWVLTPKK